MSRFATLIRTASFCAILLLPLLSFGQTGCTSLSACNYDPSATINDGSCCFDHCVTITVTADADFVDDNNRWELWGPRGIIIASGNTPGTFTICIQPEAHILTLYEDGGDGWGESSVAMNDGFLSVTFSPLSPFAPYSWPFNDEPYVRACTDPIACNYDPTATLNYGCQYPTCYLYPRCNHDFIPT